MLQAFLVFIWQIMLSLQDAKEIDVSPWTIFGPFIAALCILRVQLCTFFFLQWQRKADDMGTSRGVLRKVPNVETLAKKRYDELQAARVGWLVPSLAQIDPANSRLGVFRSSFTTYTG